MAAFGYFKICGDIDEGTDMGKVLELFRQTDVQVKMDVAIYKGDRLLHAVYPGIGSLPIISNLFVESVAEAYGSFSIIKRELIIRTTHTHVEILSFETGRQIKIELKHDSDTHEVLATAERFESTSKQMTHKRKRMYEQDQEV